MKYASKQYARALWEVWEKKQSRQSVTVLGGFIKLLKKQKQMKKLDFIVQEFEKIYLAKNNLLKAEMTAPYPLSKRSLEKTKNFISSFYKHRRNKILLEQKTDKNLIGGFQLKTGDYLIDASIKNMLTKLKQTLTND